MKKDQDRAGNYENRTRKEQEERDNMKMNDLEKQSVKMNKEHEQTFSTPARRQRKNKDSMG